MKRETFIPALYSLLMVAVIITLCIIYKDREQQIRSVKQWEKKYNDTLKFKNEIINDLRLNVKMLKNEIATQNWRFNDSELISSLYLEKRLIHLRDIGYTGTFQYTSTNDGQKISGYFLNGNERGTWTYINSNGEAEKYVWKEVRVGAQCCDGTYSSATGQGACSWHGGGCTWLVDYIKLKAE
jgi:hypothetical protein